MNSFQVELMDKIEATSKKTAKTKLLAEANEITQHFIKVAIDQNITFGITVDEDEAVKLWEKSITSKLYNKDHARWWKLFADLLQEFETRELTGNAAKDAVDQLVKSAPNTTHLKWFCRILNRNLRAGFDIRTFNKAFGKGAIKKFDVQLADTYEGQMLEGEWGFEPKLDGNRVVGYRGQPTSRGNKLYPNAQPIFEELHKFNGFLEKFVPDGEMMGNLGFDKSSGALRRSSDKGKKKADFTYWLFDLFTAEEYETQSTVPLRKRKDRLAALQESKVLPESVKVVPFFTISNPTHKQVMAITDKFVRDGFEGAMAKRMDAAAKFGRGPDLLKVKLFFEDDFTVIGFYEGKGQHKGSLGGFIVEGTIKWAPHSDAPRKTYKIRSEVGTGFGHKYDPDDPTKVLRQDVWKNKEDWLGAVVQIQFQSPTDKEQDGCVSLRLPVFVMRRKDKE